MKKLILFKLSILSIVLFSAQGFSANSFEKQFLSYSVFAAAEDEDASKASVKARDEAKNIAIEKLFNKIVLKEDREKIHDLLGNPVIDSLVSRIRISNETVSSVSYSANFTFEIDADRMLDFLLDADVKFVYLGKQVDLIVIPVFRSKNPKQEMLWEEQNNWKKALYSQKTYYQARIYPVADNSNISLYDIDEMYSSDIVYENVLEKARIVNSSAEGVFVADLLVEGNDYTLKIIHLDSKQEVVVKKYNKQELLITDSNILDYIAKDATLELNDYFLQARYQVMISEAKESFFIVYFNNLNKLTRLKSNLSSIIGIDSFSVEKFYSNKAVLKVVHKDTLAVIEEDLKSLGFYLENTQNSFSSHAIVVVKECLNSVCQ